MWTAATGRSGWTLRLRSGQAITAFWRPQLRDCPTKHYNAAAGKALPAIPLGIITRVGSVLGQRFGLP
jgi:hypothetical protein